MWVFIEPKVPTRIECSVPTYLLAAIAEENNPLGRPVGAPLCPDRFDLDALHDLEVTFSRRFWLALYQQKPTEEGEGLWFPN